METATRKPNEYRSGGNSPPSAAQQEYQQKRQAAKAARELAELRFDRHQFYNPRRELQRMESHVEGGDLARIQYSKQSEGTPHEKPAWLLAGREVGETYLRQQIEGSRSVADKEGTFHKWLVILKKYYTDNLSVGKIAEEEGMTTDAVKGVIRRLR